MLSTYNTQINWNPNLRFLCMAFIKMPTFQNDQILEFSLLVPISKPVVFADVYL